MGRATAVLGVGGPAQVLSGAGRLEKKRLPRGEEEPARYESQVWFHCRACGIVGSSGICAPCAAICHGACEGVEFAAHSPFFCDCSSGGAVFCTCSTDDPCKKHSRPCGNTAGNHGSAD